MATMGIGGSFFDKMAESCRGMGWECIVAFQEPRKKEKETEPVHTDLTDC